MAIKKILFVVLLLPLVTAMAAKSRALVQGS